MSDRGIVMLRKQLHDDLAAIERGEDPTGVIRDPGINHKIKLPIAERTVLENGLSVEAIAKASIVRRAPGALHVPGGSAS